MLNEKLTERIADCKKQKLRGIELRERLLVSRDNTVREIGIDQRAGIVVAINENVLVVKWPGYSYNPGSKFSGLTSTVKTHQSTYLIDEVVENYSCIYGSGYLVRGFILIDHDTRPVKEKL